ncbi:MAG: hypothetical protein HY842_11310 [Bacteroidetes bacterium]|nr:hypothetical protein [Bacteroidota bacterium]
MKNNLLLLALTAFFLTASPSLFAVSKPDQPAAAVAATHKTATESLHSSHFKKGKRTNWLQKKLQKKLEKKMRATKPGGRVNLGLAGLIVLLLGGLFILLGLVIPAVGIVFLVLGIIIAFIGLLLWLILGGINVDIS